MLDRFYKRITDVLLLSQRSVRKFQEREPDAIILTYGATKARKLATDRDVQHEPGWITSRRGTLILTNDKLVCSDWEIPLSSIVEAKLLRVKAYFAQGLVLKVHTQKDEYFQFGLQYDPVWEQQTSLKVEIEDGKIGYSKPSILLRVIGYIILTWILVTWGIVIYRSLFN
jgi:hypothetical protein